MNILERIDMCLLFEKTYAINADVDMIYKKTFAKHINIFKKKGVQSFIDAVQNNEKIKDYETGETRISFGVMSSSDLNSRHCKIAHDLNPVLICTGILDGSSYNPDDRLIKISLNKGAMNLLYNPKIETLDDLNIFLSDPYERKRFINEFSEASIKGSIYHELSHWINDSIHNFHITKRLRKASELGDMNVLKRGGTTLFTDYELDAQVHSIKQLKRNFNKSWDEISWKDIVQLKPAFAVIKDRLKQSSPEIQEDYFKRMIKRLHREKLLGKTMRKTFKKDMIK